MNWKTPKLVFLWSSYRHRINVNEIWQCYHCLLLDRTHQVYAHHQSHKQPSISLQRSYHMQQSLHLQQARSLWSFPQHLQICEPKDLHLSHLHVQACSLDPKSNLKTAPPLFHMVSQSRVHAHTGMLEWLHLGPIPRLIGLQRAKHIHVHILIIITSWFLDK